MKIFIGALLFVGFVSQAQAQVTPQAVKNEIASSSKISERSRAQLNTLYSVRNFEPIWIGATGFNQNAMKLKEALNKLPEHGLQVNDYLPASLAAAFSAPLAPVDQLANEVALSRILIAASTNVSVGRLDPSTVADDVKFEQRSFQSWDKVQAAVASGNFATLWDALAPKHDAYLQLKQILARLREIQAQGGFAPIEKTSATLQLGSTSSVVRELKQRAKLMGYKITNVDNQFDAEFQAALKDIQKANLADPSGKLKSSDSASWEFFSVSSARRIQQVELNMEKLRWLPPTLESRHIFVNLAIQEAKLVDPVLSNPSISVQGVINGRPARKTPSMRDEIKSVILNPTWTVPPTVFAQDKLPLIQGLQQQGSFAVRSWFAQKGFKVTVGNGELDPADIDWVSVSAKNPSFNIVQQPSYENALGVVKFPMGNPWAIYMHDTNERNLFGEKSNRLLSSGCIRLPKPIDFAEYMLRGTQWNRAAIENTVAKPGEMGHQSTFITLTKDQRLPVYIMSITARLGSDGVMRFTQDHYQQNLALLNKLTASGYYRK